MVISNEAFIKLMKQQTNMSMEELDRRFLGKAAKTKGLGSRPQVIEEVSLNRHHGVIFRFAGSTNWLVSSQIEFINTEEKTS